MGCCSDTIEQLSTHACILNYLLLFSCSVVSNSLQPHGEEDTRLPCPVLPCTLSWLKPMSIESVMPSNHLILCCPLLRLPSMFPSIRVCSNELGLPIKWTNWELQFSFSPSNEYSGLISFRIDCFVILDVQGTLKSLFQHYS